MKTLPNELPQHGYTEKAILSHTELIVFLRPYLFKANPYIIFYHVATFLPLAIFISSIGLQVAKHQYDWDMLSHFFYGFSIAFLLIPIHEGLHGLAYKYLGAPKVSYGANLRKFVFFALADKYVVDYREFRIVALTPFVVITLITSILYALSSIYWGYTCLGLIFVHSMCCGGDFGLLSYFWEHRNKTIVTYDDVEQKVSYFYEK